MTEQDVAELATRVCWLAFGLGAAFGAVAQRTRFCTMGAIADVMSMGDWARARMWALAAAVAMLGFSAMVALGWVKAADAVVGGPRLLWGSAIAGGLMFGFGMTLASGCGSRNLVRLGGGNLKSLVVLLVLGLSALVALRGLTAVARVRWFDPLALDLGRAQDLPTLLAPWLGDAAAALGPLLALAIVAWVLRHPDGRSAAVLGGGIGVGLVVAALYAVSGRLGFVAEDPSTLEPLFVATNSRRLESLSLVGPVGWTLDWLMLFSDASKRVTLGIASVGGIVAGAAAAALADRSFRWEGFGRVDDLALHLVGAALMGTGGVMALGCTIGQGVSGVATLALGSFIALAAIVAGGVLGIRYQTWRLERA